MKFDGLMLSRIQFAFTIAFHIIFPAFTIGLASWFTFSVLRCLRPSFTAFARSCPADRNTAHGELWRSIGKRRSPFSAGHINARTEMPSCASSPGGVTP